MRRLLWVNPWVCLLVRLPRSRSHSLLSLLLLLPIGLGVARLVDGWLMVCARAVRYVYGPQVMDILLHTQPQPPTDDQLKHDPGLDKNGWQHAVRPWQHDRVVDVLLGLLSLTEPIGALSDTLRSQEDGRALVVHTLLDQKVKARS